MSNSMSNSAYDRVGELWKVHTYVLGTEKAREESRSDGADRRCFPSFRQGLTTEREGLLAENKNLKSQNSTLLERIAFLEAEVERLKQREKGGVAQVGLFPCPLVSSFSFRLNVEGLMNGTIPSLTLLWFSILRTLGLAPFLYLPLTRGSSQRPRSLHLRLRSSRLLSLELQPPR